MPSLRRRPSQGDDAADDVAFEPQDIAGLFATPPWLRQLGETAWLAVGVTLLTIGIIWLLTLTQTIVVPVITAAVVAATT